jgi:hypothetical protein
MTQVKLDRKPYAKHTFYKGTYTYRDVEYAFDLTVEESENSARPAILVEFGVESRLLPFDYGKACKEILAIYLPDEKIN